MLKLQEVPELGSNENGYYRKWPDGTLECWGISTVPLKSTTAWKNGLYYDYNDVAIRYPIEFLDSPVINISVRNNVFLTVSLYTPYKTGINSVIVYSGDSYSTHNCECYWYAIGRWK